MHWLKTEYLLKGLFLGLVLYAGLQQGYRPGPTPADTLGPINLTALAGVGAALLLSAAWRLSQGYRLSGRVLPFLLFLLLESPWLIYAGVLGGFAAGIYLSNSHFNPQPNYQEPLEQLLPHCLVGGLVVGAAFGLSRRLRKFEVRLGAVAMAAAGVAVGVLCWLKLSPPAIGMPENIKFDEARFAWQMLLGIPFLYLLTFAGQEEESEADVGGYAALMAVGVWMLTYKSESDLWKFAGFIVPTVVYFYYCIRILPRLRVLKHAFRGISYARVGRHRKALLAFRRALQLDPQHPLARSGLWQVHRDLDLNQLARDPHLLALVDFDLCLERAGSLLVQGKPNADQKAEALRLLELIMSQRPELSPAVDYWRAVSLLHDKQTDEAVALLERVLDPAHYGRDNPQRRDILPQAWQLVLLLHPEMNRRIGEAQIGKPGRRMEAIAAVERHLALNPGDQNAQGLKRLLYQDLSEEEYALAAEGEHPPNAATQDGGAPAFDFKYVQQLGLQLVNDDGRWLRGGEYLRMAADGLPLLGPTLFVQIAKAHQRAGHDPEAIHNFELAKRAGRSVGARNLADPERKAYFATVKYLGEYYQYHGDVDNALENLHLFAESENSGIETYRTLADLYERKGDPLSAARCTDQGLLYSAKDKDLLQKKDKYYYSIDPEKLRERLESVRKSFDVTYCLSKARSILDGPHQDLEWLDMAHHLATLALVVQPENRSGKVLLARVQLRHGERDEAVAMLESVRSPKPEKFADREDEDGWYISCQLLGDLYMELGKADMAVPCYQDFRKSIRSGARTYFKLGQAYEQLGDSGKAVKCYEMVAAYDGNPLAPEARSAIYRLQQAAGR